MERFLDKDDETRELVEAYARQNRQLRELFGKPGTGVPGGLMRNSLRDDH